MASVDDVQGFLDEQWTVLTWLDDKGSYRALAIDAAETTQHAMEQERQMGKGSQLSEALCNLVEKMADKPSSESDTTAALVKVATHLVEWGKEPLSLSTCALLGPLITVVHEAKAALELVEKKGV